MNIFKIFVSKKDEPHWVGPLSEFLTALLGYLSFQGIFPLSAAADTTSLVVVIALISWRLWKKEGWEQLITLIRKALSLTPAVLVALGIMTSANAASLFLIFPPLFAMLWSFKSAAKPKSKYP